MRWCWTGHAVWGSQCSGPHMRILDDDENWEIFIGGLPQDVSEDDLYEYFGKFGDIESVRLKKHSMTGRSRGFAFLLYKSKESINNALEYKDHKLKVIK